MKIIIKTIIFAALTILPYAVFSQSGCTKATDIEVNGIFIGGTYTKAQVQAKWGIPTKYWSGTSEFGLDEEYYYSNNLFRFSDSGIFVEFIIKTSGFLVYPARGGIKVGDNISRIQAIGFGAPVLQSDGSYYLWRNNSDDPLIFKQSNGVITQISFTTSI